MNRVTSFARTLFICNHGSLSNGAVGLARTQGAPLLSQENIDLKTGIRRV